MSGDDARLAVYATPPARSPRPKISARFRPASAEKALPSIASVSKFSILTPRPRREGDARRRRGRRSRARVTHRPARRSAPRSRFGTSFTTCRRGESSCKALSTESAHVTEVAQAAALGEPGVTLVLARDGRVVKEWLPRVVARGAHARRPRRRRPRGLPAAGVVRSASKPSFRRPERARSGLPPGSRSSSTVGRSRTRTLARSVALAVPAVSSSPGAIRSASFISTCRTSWST